jgi:hypothetical protein
VYCAWIGLDGALPWIAGLDTVRRAAGADVLVLVVCVVLVLAICVWLELVDLEPDLPQPASATAAASAPTASIPDVFRARISGPLVRFFLLWTNNG